MNSWIPKNKIVKLAITTVALSILLYIAGLLVVLGEIKKTESLYNDTNSESFKEEKFLAVKSIAEANKEIIQTLRNFFIKKGDEVKFIEEIEKMAKDSSLKFQIYSINVVANQGNSLKEDVDINMMIEGSWKNVIRFIDELRKMPFGVSIQKINLDAATPGNWSGSVEFIVFREK